MQVQPGAVQCGHAEEHPEHVGLSMIRPRLSHWVIAAFVETATHILPS